MAEFELEPGEKLLLEDGDAGWWKTKWQCHSGRLYLTDKRIVFEQKAAVPMVGMLIREFGRKVIFKMSNDTVKSVLRKNVGYNQEVVFIDKFDQEWRFSVYTQDEIIGKMEPMITWGK